MARGAGFPGVGFRGLSKNPIILGDLVCVVIGFIRYETILRSSRMVETGCGLGLGVYGL